MKSSKLSSVNIRYVTLRFETATCSASQYSWHRNTCYRNNIENEIFLRVTVYHRTKASARKRKGKSTYNRIVLFCYGEPRYVPRYAALGANGRGAMHFRLYINFYIRYVCFRISIY